MGGTIKGNGANSILEEVEVALDGTVADFQIVGELLDGDAATNGQELDKAKEPIEHWTAAGVSQF